MLLILATGCLGRPNDDLSGDDNKSPTDLQSIWGMGKNDFPLDLGIDSGFNAEEIVAINEMGANWTNATNDEIDFFHFYNLPADTPYNQLNQYKDNKMGVYKITKWFKDLPNQALAVTQIYGTKYETNIEINHADILINYEYFNFATGSEFGYDLRSVVLHEMGHFLGMYHENSSPANSVMYPSINRFTQNRVPKSIDIKNIKNKYLNPIQNHQSESLVTQKTSIGHKSKPDIGEPIIIQMELYPDGLCVHRTRSEFIGAHF